MKKTFTLVAIATVLTTASFAQFNHPRDNDNGYGRDREVTMNNDRGGRGWGRGTYYFTAKEKDMQLFSINRDYNRRIESVKHRFFMGRAKKEQIICSLEAQRDTEIRAVVARFNDRRNLYDGRDNWGRDHDRKNNW